MEYQLELDEGFDPLQSLYDEAADLNITPDQVDQALAETNLQPEDISLNQPFVDGTDIPHGYYLLYKGTREEDEEFKGWVTDDEQLAAQYTNNGQIKAKLIQYNGQKQPK